MWKRKNSLCTNYRYAYDVDLVSRAKMKEYDRYLWSRFEEVKVQAWCWCEEHCQSNWSQQGMGFSFDSKEDAVMFKLTWAGQVN